MGRRRPGQVDPRWSPRGGRGQIGAHEPALEGPFRGDGLPGRHPEQFHADQAGAPGGVLAAQPQGELHRVRGRGRAGRAVVVIRGDAVTAAVPKPPEEAANGGFRQIQGRGDLAGPMPLLPEPEHRLTDRDGDGTRHGQTSREPYHEINHPILYRCHEAIKLGVGISRSNLMSRDSRRSPRWRVGLGGECRRSGRSRYHTWNLAIMDDMILEGVGFALQPGWRFD
jgi:hypothetical protein